MSSKPRGAGLSLVGVLCTADCHRPHPLLNDAQTTPKSRPLAPATPHSTLSRYRLRPREQCGPPIGLRFHGYTGPAVLLAFRHVSHGAARNLTGDHVRGSAGARQRPWRRWGTKLGGETKPGREAGSRTPPICWTPPLFPLFILKRGLSKKE